MILTLAVLLVILSLGYGAAALLANGMSSAPNVKGVPVWPMYAGLALAVALMIGRHYGW